MPFRKATTHRLLGASAVLLAAGAWLLGAPMKSALELSSERAFADGRSTVLVKAQGRSLFGTRAAFPKAATVTLDEESRARLGVRVLYAHDKTVVLRAGTTPGRLEVRLEDEDGDRLDARIVEWVPDPADRDGDGLPDVTELLTEEDRAAFTAWFTAIAEAQAFALDDAWAKVHQDCAGLVRFAFREALRAHDRAWLKKRRFLPRIAAPDVQAVRYPELPFIGDLPFRQTAGPFDPARPIEEQLTAAASARTLWQHNSVFVSREIGEARAGDLLFFRVPEDTGSRMHTMIVLGEAPGADQHQAGARVVYHTGLDGEAGEVRLVSLDELLSHPDAGWRPLPHNPRFLGVYRLIHVVHERAESESLPLRPRPGGLL